MIPIIFLLITSIWVPVNGTDYQQIPIIYGEIPVCGGYSIDNGDIIKGCHTKAPNLWFIQIDERYMFERATCGNVWTHELCHAFGMSDAEMLWWEKEGQYR